MKRYYLVSIDWLEFIVGLAFGSLLGFLTYSNLNNWVLTLINGGLSIIFTAIIFSGLRHFFKMKKLPDNIDEDFFSLIDAILHVAEEKDEKEKKKKIRDLPHYLRAAIDACRGKILVFDPDNVAINMFHEVNGTISITAAAPREWLNPTFNFFLIKNYISSIKHQVNSKDGNKTMKFSESRTAPPFVDFEKRKKKIVEDLSTLDKNNPFALKDYLSTEKICIRFYFLPIDEIQSNKSILETLVAGHELFGCYLYIVVKEGLHYDDLTKFLSVIGYDFKENNHKTDLMIAQRNDAIDVIYRKEDNLRQNRLDDAESQTLIQKTIKQIAQYVFTNYENHQCVFNWSPEHPSEFVVNKQYPQVYVEKT